MNLREIFTPDTFVISDQHFGHKNIEEFEPSRSARCKELGFETFEEMIIAKHNSVVKEDDIVVFLGDFSFSDPLLWSSKLNGRKFLIVGNHDRPGPQPYKDFEFVFRGVYIQHNEFVLEYHEEDQLLSGVIIDIDGKALGFSHYCVGIDDNYDHKNTKIPARKKVLESLFDSHCVDINIHGHLHSKTIDSNRHINVSCEQIDYTPVKLKDIL